MITEIDDNAFRMADSELFKEYAYWATLLVGKGRFKLLMIDRQQKLAQKKIVVLTRIGPSRTSNSPWSA